MSMTTSARKGLRSIFSWQGINRLPRLSPGLHFFFRGGTVLHEVIRRPKKKNQGDTGQHKPSKLQIQANTKRAHGTTRTGFAGLLTLEPHFSGLAILEGHLVGRPRAASRALGDQLNIAGTDNVAGLLLPLADLLDHRLSATRLCTIYIVVGRGEEETGMKTLKIPRVSRTLSQREKNIT